MECLLCEYSAHEFTFFYGLGPLGRYLGAPPDEK